ncbi:MAG TPA: crosslink repair DNA glycosylase YcaQ family protein [Vicinamibacteria bacterium]|nr:crosslink repair DNA glycosylase YcaQ family protein [Vicinamibacteria bacterium]
MDSLSIRAARRRALARAGLLIPEPTGLPRRARGRSPTAIAAAHAVIRRFGYLQLDTVSVAGARSHTIVLLSRLTGLDARVGEELLRPGAPIFEYWGHEASWIPLSLYPAFEFRRREFRSHPWWGDLVREHPKVARDLRRRIRDEGPLRSVDMEAEGRTGKGWWDLGVMKRVASSLWSSGELAIRERRNFQRTYDLAERVIPEGLRRRPLSKAEALETLLLAALEGHGWATTGTLASTWRLRNRKAELLAALRRLQEKGQIQACALEGRDGSPTTGWIRPADRELAARLERTRPRRDTGVLLSPFDPVLWDRPRVARLFGFDALLEIFKPAPQRVYGYYCLPVLAGEHLVARVDLKAERKREELRVVSAHYEDAEAAVARQDREAARLAVARYGEALGLRPVW